MAQNSALLKADGKLVSVALDHGVFGAGAITSGMENLASILEIVLGAQPDAVQLSLGAAEHFAKRFSSTDVSLVARLDLTNAYSAKPQDSLYSLVVANGVERAADIGAHAVVVNLLSSPSDAKLHRECIEIVNIVRAQCLAHNMPLIVEPLALLESQGTRYGVNGNVDDISPLVRQAFELGADVIKADPTDDLTHYPQVIESAAVPVLVRGGGRIDDAELITRTEALMNAGAAGVVYGRNIFQHTDPAGITGRLMNAVHGA